MHTVYGIICKYTYIYIYIWMIDGFHAGSTSPNSVKFTGGIIQSGNQGRA